VKYGSVGRITQTYGLVCFGSNLLAHWILRE
jgi:hypothetical protein